MKKSILIIVGIVVIASVNFSAVIKPDSQTRTIVNKMLKAIDTHKGCTYTMRSLERITGMKELRGGDIFTKINVSPHKTYMKMITDPNKGTEILYVEGERSNKALVNPGKWLPTITLDPMSGLLTKEQHHTLLSAGFSLISKIVGDAVKKADEQAKFDIVFKYAGDVTWNSRQCYKLVIEDPTWAYTTYTAKKGDNMYTVASKLLIPEYSLVELDGVKNFEENLGGKTLKVPTSYAKKTIFYVDKETNFPIYQECSDDKGVFERYEFYNVVINPAFKADEFTKGFGDYKF
ncbi:MAG: hypothetical protein JWO06_3201 [Bacteroidota bacterium]|nr:hypothetical protein [Bacteroidota bacterium]